MAITNLIKYNSHLSNGIILATKKHFFIQQSKKQLLLGVDIGTYAIRLIGLSLDNHRLRLELCTKIILSQNSSDKEIATTIKQQLDNHKILFKKAAVAIAASHVLFKKLNVTNLQSRRTMEEFILFNIVQEMKLQQKEINYTYEFSSNHANIKSANIVAVKRSYVIKLEKLLYASGLMAKIVDVDNYVLLRAIHHTAKDLQYPILIINIEEQRVIYIIANQEINSPEYTEILENIDTTNCSIITESTIAKLKDLATRMPIKQVMLGGNRKIIENLAGVIAEKHVAPCDPLAKLPCSDTLDRATVDQLSPEMLIAFGLALRIQDEN